MRKSGFTALRVDYVSIGTISFENAPDIANIVKQASSNDMCVIVSRCGHQPRPASHDLVCDLRHEHCMFNIVVERVAVANPVKCKSRKMRNEFCQTRVRRSKSAVQLLREVGAQSLRR